MIPTQSGHSINHKLTQDQQQQAGVNLELCWKVPEQLSSRILLKTWSFINGMQVPIRILLRVSSHFSSKKDNLLKTVILIQEIKMTSHSADKDQLLITIKEFIVNKEWDINIAK